MSLYAAKIALMLKITHRGLCDTEYLVEMH
jgi:hypothetical protein